MKSKIKKGLYCTVLSATVSLCTHSVYACETETLIENPHTSKQRLSFQQDPLFDLGFNKPSHLSHETRKIKGFSGAPVESKISLWMIPYYFISTLLEPFIEDGGKIVSTIKEEAKKVEKEGPISYGWNRRGAIGNAVFHTGKTIIENPLDTVSTVGGVLIGSGFYDHQSILGASLMISNGIKNSRQLYNLATSIKGETYLQTAGTIALTGLAFYALSSPIVEAASITLNGNTSCQINQHSIVHDGGCLTCSMAIPGGPYVTLWQNNAGNLVGSIYYDNCTFVNQEFTVSSSPIDNDHVGLSCASFNDRTGNWFATWSDSTNVFYRLLSSSGLAVCDPIQLTNSNPYSWVSAAAVGSRGVVGFINQTAGNYSVTSLAFSSDCTRQTEPSVISSSSSILGYVSATPTSQGTVYLSWSENCNNILGCEISPTDGLCITHVETVNLSPRACNPSVTGLTGGNTTAIYTTTVDTSTNIVGREINVIGSPVGDEFQVFTLPYLPGDNELPCATSLGNNALVSYINSTHLYDLQVQLLDSSGNNLANATIADSGRGSFNSISVASQGNNQAIIAWQNTDSRSNNIYARGITVSSGGKTRSTGSLTSGVNTLTPSNLLFLPIKMVSNIMGYFWK